MKVLLKWDFLSEMFASTMGTQLLTIFTLQTRPYLWWMSRYLSKICSSKLIHHYHELSDDDSNQIMILFLLQDVGNFLVTDETSFESVFESEFVRVDRCLTDDGQVSCSKSQLFTDRSGIGKKRFYSWLKCENNTIEGIRNYI